MIVVTTNLRLRKTEILHVNAALPYHMYFTSPKTKFRVIQ